MKRPLPRGNNRQWRATVAPSTGTDVTWEHQFDDDVVLLGVMFECAGFHYLCRQTLTKPRALLWYQFTAAAGGFDLGPTLVRAGEKLVVRYVGGNDQDSAHFCFVTASDWTDGDDIVGSLGVR
jgi:hypothetical protein